jgi:UMF1 family MFS transporter
MKAFKPIFTFMIAYFFFNDALQTAIAMMAVYSKIVLGFSTGQFILLYLVSTVSSIIGSFVFGYITKRVGAKKAVIQVSIIMIIAIVLAAITTSTGLFWVAGSLFGIALGSMWVTSRTLIVELTPEEKRGEFFGLFAFSGKVSAIIGPIIYGSITFLFADSGTLASRFAIGSLAVMVLIGLLFHIRIKDLTVKN